MNIGITGSTGLIGSNFVDKFRDKYSFSQISTSLGVDITDNILLREFLDRKKPDLILHLAAKTNVDQCENDQEHDSLKLKYNGWSDDNFGESIFNEADWKGGQSAFAINTYGTKNLADWARDNNVPIIYISTDFIFNGDKDYYTEESTPSPVNWYGQTKFWGEKVLGDDSLIVRISYPFGYKSEVKKDFIWAIMSILKEKGSIDLIDDQVITPTFIEDIVNGIDFLIEKKTRGVINMVGNNSYTPFEIGEIITKKIEIKDPKVGKVKREDFYSNRAKRPFKVILKNDKLGTLGFNMTDFPVCIDRIKKDL